MIRILDFIDRHEALQTACGAAVIFAVCVVSLLALELFVAPLPLIWGD